MDEKKEYPKGIKYKINENGTYCVSVKEWNDKTYYTVKIKQKRYDGTYDEFNRNLYFNECEPPQNGDYIKIISGYESNYVNKNDRYNCITAIVVNEYELSKPIEEIKSDAFAEYNAKKQEFGDNEISPDDVPF